MSQFLKVQSDVFKCLGLSNQQSKTTQHFQVKKILKLEKLEPANVGIFP